LLRVMLDFHLVASQQKTIELPIASAKQRVELDSAFSVWIRKLRRRFGSIPSGKGARKRGTETLHSTVGLLQKKTDCFGNGRVEFVVGDVTEIIRNRIVEFVDQWDGDGFQSTADVIQNQNWNALWIQAVAVPASRSR